MNARVLLYLSFCGLRLAAQTAASCPTDPTVLPNIVNTAAGVTSDYAGYTFLTISGLNMPITGANIGPIVPGGTMGTTVGNVQVLVNGVHAYPFYVTPRQVQLLLPRAQANSCVTLYIEANSLIQFQAQIFLNATAPGLYTYSDGQTVVASHTDWSPVNSASPAQPGEWISLWAAGLGLTNPDFEQNQTPAVATQLADLTNFSVLLNGVPVDPSRIGYAGIAPDYAGLYQINVLLPADTPPNPEIRLKTADNISPPSRFLIVQ